MEPKVARNTATYWFSPWVGAPTAREYNSPRSEQKAELGLGRFGAGAYRIKIETTGAKDKPLTTS
jgi:hypothetical protein